MRVLLSACRLAAAVIVIACGAAPAPAPAPVEPAIGRAIAVEWKAAQGESDQVVVTIVVDGKPVELGTLHAATDTEPGTPWTCALRAAHGTRTELACGDLASYFVAELHRGELVISLVAADGQREVTRVPVVGQALAVKPYELPR